MNVIRMIPKILVACFGMAACLFPQAASALDPCGMVPPIYTGPGVPIVRTGLQQTYVFYKDGVETFVIKPGFRGRVEDFGMLIPFPNPPALRKVPDNIFQQIDNAIDPPEVVVDLTPPPPMAAMADGAAVGGAPMRLGRVAKNSVVVLNQEAVGMYEVAVLAAGSADALKAWMDQHKYQYPKGMDKVAEEYIRDQWCFVAVKTKVGQKKAVDPRAGLRSVDTSKPANTVFDGNVQGMGFRFKSDKLVVPMRLSAFNDGDMRNVVYLLTDHGKRIRNIPEEYVVRQIDGRQLFKNVTRPLPLRVIGGTEKDIPQWRRKNLDKERDPEPKNGVAKVLFSSDLLATESGNLSLEMEEEEKDLLAIGEHLGLRGDDYDQEIRLAQKRQAEEISDEAIELVSQMTLTVVDGDFPREVISRENLTFANYNMPAAKNKRRVYDATIHGPGRTRRGRLIGQIESAPASNRQADVGIASIALAVSVLGLGIVLTTVLMFRRDH